MTISLHIIMQYGTKDTICTQPYYGIYNHGNHTYIYYIGESKSLLIHTKQPNYHSLY